MAQYLYRAATLDGQTVEGFMDGKDEENIVQSLHQLGYIPIRITSTQERRPRLRLSSFLPQRVGVKNLLIFTQELSTLISAGLPLDRSLSILGTLTENERLSETVKDVLKRIEGGNSLAEALGNHPRIFPKLYVNMVKAGESGGFLEVILSRLAQYLQSTKEIRDYLISVMIYPLILIIVSGVSIAILMTFVIPRFARIFSDMGQAIPLSTQIMLSISHSVKSYWWMGLGIIVMIYLGLRIYNQDEERRLRWDKFKLRWVAVGDLIKKVEVARFSRTLGTLIQSGVSILPALNLVKEISQNRVISRSIAHVHDRLREGKAISKSLEEAEVFPPLAVHLISVGEETGKLDAMLIKVAEAYEENVRNAIKRFVSLLEPLIILVMGAVVGFIVISMLLAIFSINEIPF
ncbi:MAG: type II secretion system protein GspF [Deltaproteobacteria bacterium CG03_land_8_20_14_0_80_45_14]|nr:MAG: type II secretion system protein GspF [Deltaproteobacteria bacterium CG03_land_8_20_14_0_80_45_14]